MISSQVYCGDLIKVMIGKELWNVKNCSNVKHYNWVLTTRYYTFLIAFSLIYVYYVIWHMQWNANIMLYDM